MFFFFFRKDIRANDISTLSFLCADSPSITLCTRFRLAELSPLDFILGKSVALLENKFKAVYVLRKKSIFKHEAYSCFQIRSWGVTFCVIYYIFNFLLLVKFTHK